MSNSGFPIPAAPIAVNSVAQLNAALSNAKGGEVINLAAGTYSGALLQGFNFANPVTIQSADPGHLSVFTDLLVRSSSGLNIQNLEVQIQNTAVDNTFQIFGSSNINITDLYVHGSLDGNPTNDGSGLMIRNSQNVNLYRSNFEQLKFGVTILDDQNVSIVQNNIHDIQTDGIRGGGTSNLSIINNTLSSFHPIAGDHPDAIQLWTTNTTVAAHDINIADNTIWRGGGAPTQGVFIQATANLPFQHLTISNNLVLGGLYNGLDVENATAPVIKNNIVAGYADQISWVRLDGTTSAVVTDNQAEAYLKDGSAGMTPGAVRDMLVTPVTDGGDALMHAWLTKMTSAYGGTLGLSQFASTLATLDKQIGRVDGTSGNDQIIESTGGKIVYGGDGNDTIIGRAAGDQLFGGAGDDLIQGGVGAQTVSGGLGADALVSGAGPDHFLYGAVSDSASASGVDIIYGFNPGKGDVIDLSPIDAMSNSPEWNDAFRFIGSQPFNHSVGELRFEQVGQFTMVYGDTNGDGVADLTIAVLGKHSLTSANFVL